MREREQDRTSKEEASNGRGANWTIGKPLNPVILQQVRRTLVMKQWTRELMYQHKTITTTTINVKMQRQGDERTEESISVTL